MPGSGKRAAFFCVAIVALLLGLRLAVEAQESNTFFADFAFHFDCRSGSVGHEESIERFLKQKGFRVLNIVLERRKRKLAPMPQQLFIDAIDGQRRHIRVSANISVADSYNLRLYSPPPTIRAVDLEDAILTLVMDQLRCGISQVSRNENGPTKREVYDRHFRTIEHNFLGSEL